MFLINDGEFSSFFQLQVGLRPTLQDETIQRI